jgi:hypothetical protein
VPVNHPTIDANVSRDRRSEIASDPFSDFVPKNMRFVATGTRVTLFDVTKYNARQGLKSINSCP